MAEGLRPHHHQEFEYHTVQYFDKKRHVIVKKIQYMCMICGRIRHEKYNCYVPRHLNQKQKHQREIKGNMAIEADISFFCTQKLKTTQQDMNKTKTLRWATRKTATTQADATSVLKRSE